MSKERFDRAPVSAQQPGYDAGSDRAPATTSRAEIDAFLDHVKALGPAAKSGKRGRLIFALDATMSRQPTWDTACVCKPTCFVKRPPSAASISSSSIIAALPNAKHRRGSRSRAARYALMSRIDCRGGHTQIGKILAHARRENDSREGRYAGLCRRRDGRIARRSLRRRRRAWAAQPAGLHVSGRLRSGLRAGIPRNRPLDARRLLPVSPGAAHELGELLRAAAAYAAGGMKALADLETRNNAARYGCWSSLNSHAGDSFSASLSCFLLLWAGQRLFQDRSQAGRAPCARFGGVAAAAVCRVSRAPRRVWRCHSGRRLRSWIAWLGIAVAGKPSPAARGRARGRPRGFAPHISKWNSITIAAPCMGAFSPAAIKELRWTRSTSRR
jgi:hypothetical protein